jgi:hypothetical protein
MSVLVFTETSKGKIKKASFEAVNYAAGIAAATGTTVTAILAGDATADAASLGKAGATKVLSLAADFPVADAQQLSACFLPRFNRQSHCTPHKRPLIGRICPRCCCYACYEWQRMDGA